MPTGAGSKRKLKTRCEISSDFGSDPQQMRDWVRDCLLASGPNLNLGQPNKR